MHQRHIQRLTHSLIFLLLCYPALSFASFIETTMGAAVLNDATAAYFNPAALVLLKNPQLIPLGTIARFRTQFSGQSTSVATGFTASGTSSSTTNYYSPSLYAGMPINNRVTLGLAIVSNFANRDPESNSILRYVQSSNTIQDYDVVPAISAKINDFLAVGGGINFSYTDFHLHPITGLPGSNIADSESNNHSDGTGVGANAGFLLRPTKTTLIGFNYRTVTTYRESGDSTYHGTITVTSDRYHFKMHTPARSILSISQLVTPTIGFITTVQRMQWSITRYMHINGIATANGSTPEIINASVPYYLHDTWLLTLGAQYKFRPDWIARVAATYNQSPSDGHYQVSTGDSYIVGTSLGYEVNKTVTIDGSYAHAFMQNQTINNQGTRFIVNGTNRGSRDSVSLKITLNA